MQYEWLFLWLCFLSTVALRCAHAATSTTVPAFSSLGSVLLLEKEKEMAARSSALAWRIPGTVEPGGLPSMGSHRVGHD